ncbi:mannonate dehydratase [uncultured Eudoraea sp.]|uniref:mannonate dehydratase n=1 Tax=uncultured Eudoraea sp. TaxID=1035614 RepID=UPI00260459EB|nr:mannonate dehydratase [uncultured Eudoraea sp.]
MVETMRWYGPNDPVTLSDIRQAGATGIVTALHEIPNGEVWSTDAIRNRKRLIEDAGLRWSVAESVPVHEHIKTRSGNFEKLIENYKSTIQNLASENINIICYNFMPILDWIRTELDHALPNGAKTLNFEIRALAAFDCFILKRKGAKESYPADIIKKAETYYHGLGSAEIEKLKRTILDNLPGAETGYTLEEFQEALDSYQNIDAATLEKNLHLFLNEVLPVAEVNNVFLAIHPDDPPYPILGLPRIMSTSTDIKRILSENDSPNNGITFCTGSLGVRVDNNLVQIIRDHGDHIHFVHLRSTRRNEDGDFYEACHLEGDVPMYSVVKELLTLQEKRNIQLPMRPDHGQQLLNDLNIKTNPGYSGIGRLKGLAELRGLMYGILNQKT